MTRAENGAGWSGRSKQGRGREGRGGVEAAAVLIPPPLPWRRGKEGWDALRLAICEFW